MESQTRNWVIGCSASAVIALGGLAILGWYAFRMLGLGEIGDGIREVDDPRPGRAVVRVTDDTGTPVAGAVVDALVEPRYLGDFNRSFGFDPAADPAPPQSVVTALDGSATVPDLASGQWWLRVSAPGRATGFARIEGGHAARHALGVQLGAAHRLHGSLTQSDGKPALGALVLAVATSDRHFRGTHWAGALRARCDESGAFVLDGVASGVVALWIVFPGDAPVESVRVLVPTDAPLALEVAAQRRKCVVGTAAPRPAEEPDPGRISIRGAVESQDGTRLEGARVAALHHGEYGSEEPFAWTHTDADGAFSLDGIPGDASIALQYSAKGHRNETTMWDVASSFGRRSAQRLQRGIRVRGSVRTADGKTPRDVRVWIYRLGENRAVAADALSSLWAGTPQWSWRAEPTPLTSEGRFETTWDWDPGRLMTYATADGYAPGVSAPFVAEDGPDGAHTGVLLEPGVTLRGRLLAPGGSPLRRRLVRIHPPAFVEVWGAVCAVTDADGRFSIPHVAQRPLVVSLGGDGAEKLKGVTLTPSASEVDVQLVSASRRNR